ncbi:hypothetical protein [Dyella acidisoli]|nr:hypothetical protein [Dyella acidisoli]
MLVLFLCAGYARAANPPSISGIWKGTLGAQPITACYTSAEYGFYYYDKHATPIRLSLYVPANLPDVNAAQLRFKEASPGHKENQADSVWTIRTADAERLVAIWSGHGKELAIRLNRVRNSGNCGDKSFIDGIHFPVASTEIDKVSGIHYVKLSYMNADEFRNERPSMLIRLVGKDKITAKINADLLDVMPDSPTYCPSGDNNDSAATESPGSGELEPVFLTEHWVYATWVFYPGSCGSAEVPERGGVLWNRVTGEKMTDLWSWFGSGKKTATKSLELIIGRHMEKSVARDEESDEDVVACDDSMGVSDDIDVSMDAKGFVFWLGAGSMRPCTVQVPFAEIIPMLNDKGRANVASIRTDLARYP